MLKGWLKTTLKNKTTPEQGEFNLQFVLKVTHQSVDHHDHDNGIYFFFLN